MARNTDNIPELRHSQAEDKRKRGAMKHTWHHHWLVIILAVMLVLSGCGDNRALDNGMGTVSITPSAVPIGAAQTGQTATLDILGYRSGIPMMVNPDGTVEVTVGGVPAGTWTFQITYNAMSVAGLVTIAQTSGEGTVAAGSTTNVNLTTINYQFDDDHDTALNLDEIKAGTNPNDAVSRPTNAVEVATSGDHACARLVDTTLRCWGSNAFGQLGNNTTEDSSLPVKVANLSGVIAVAVGGQHTCVLLSNGTARCWGSNGAGQLGNNSTANSLVPVTVSNLSGVIAVAVGGQHTCVLLSNGTVRCWGSNGAGQLGNNSTANSLVPVTVSSLSSVTTLTAGSSHTCARLSDSTVRCWGSNRFGGLGNNNIANSPVPVIVSNLSTASAVTAGDFHTCARTGDGGVRCWGWNVFGQLGTTSPESCRDSEGFPMLCSLVPLTVSNLGGVTTVDAGGSHTCARLSNGTVRCWGSNGSGQLGDGSFQDQPTPVVTSIQDVSYLSSGGAQSCAVVGAGLVMCWGFTPRPATLTPVLVANVTGVATGPLNLTTGEEHTCRRTSGSIVQCWGRNEFGQLGNGSTNDSSVPVTVSNLSNVTVVTGGGSHTCARVGGQFGPNTVSCWGRGDLSQLGNNSTSHSSVPVTVSNLSNVTALMAGGAHTCAVVDTLVRCWGWNDFGQLGNNSKISSAVPVTATNLSGVTTVAVGGQHTCALLNDGSVRCWGGAGRLGTNNTGDSSVPVAVSNLSGVTALAAGGFHTCALLSDSTVRCWGFNSSGQLGNNTTADSTVPVVASNLSGVTALAAGGFHTCALLSDSTIRCWGSNFSGELGNSSTNSSSLPVVVRNIGNTGDLTDVTAVAAGRGHTCATITTQIACWGSNFAGQLGNGAETGTNIPLVVSGIP
jgi:alpha-tubulin suppressor-like RCC1 family protein